MINEAQMELVDEVSDVLMESDLELGDMLEPLVYVFTDAMSQLTERKFNKLFAEDVCKMVAAGYATHCMISATDTLTQH